MKINSILYHIINFLQGFYKVSGKMVGKVVAVPKVKEPTSDDVPWGGGYVPPILINP